MNPHTSLPLNRKLRRRHATEARNGRTARSATVTPRGDGSFLIHFDLGGFVDPCGVKPSGPQERGVPLNTADELLDSVARLVNEAVIMETALLVMGVESTEPTLAFIAEPSGLPVAAPARSSILFAVAGAEALAILGLRARVVVGAAAWAAGTSSWDSVCHGFTQFDVRPDVASGNYHAWIEIEGDGFVDFSTGWLETKFLAAHAEKPMSVEQKEWRRFGEFVTYPHDHLMPSITSAPAFWYSEALDGHYAINRAVEPSSLQRLHGRVHTLLASDASLASLRR